MSITMNVIDIVIIVIMGASIIYGLYRGFVQTLLSVACCLISVLVAFAYGPKLADVVSGSQGVSSTLATYTDAVTRVGDYSLASTPVSQLTDSVIQQVLDSTGLPDSISSRALLCAAFTTLRNCPSSSEMAPNLNESSSIRSIKPNFLVYGVVLSFVQSAR